MNAETSTAKTATPAALPDETPMPANRLRRKDLVGIAELSVEEIALDPRHRRGDEGDLLPVRSRRCRRCAGRRS